MSVAPGRRWDLLSDISPDGRLSNSALLRWLLFEAEVNRLAMVGFDDTNQGLIQLTQLKLLIDSGVNIVGFTGLNRLIVLFFAPV